MTLKLPGQIVTYLIQFVPNGKHGVRSRVLAFYGPYYKSFTTLPQAVFSQFFFNYICNIILFFNILNHYKKASKQEEQLFTI